jgi:hypothetical protein
MHTKGSFSGICCRLASIGFLATACASLLPAQQTSAAQSVSTPVLSATAAAAPSSQGSGVLTGASSSSSSSSSDAVASVVDSNGMFLFNSAAIKAAQPPPRRYGRPNYSDSHMNPDGSPKFAFLVGAGLGMPIGNTHKYETPSWGLQVGVGRNFSKNTAIVAQFDYDHFGLQGATLANFGYVNDYYFYCSPANQAAGFCSPISGQIDGSNHVWSFTLNPTFTFAGNGSTGAYVVFGGGFYHKVTNFTLPTVSGYCDYYGCYQYQSNQVYDHYTSNAGGANGGLGFTWKFSQFSNERFYMEARYVVIFNQQRMGLTPQNVVAMSNTYRGYNLYPQNSNRTTYIPIKFGIRF